LAEYLRITEKRTLQTAVHQYQHPETGRRVTLVATMTFGDPGYYIGLREVINDREAAGAVVHCAGSGRVPDDPAISEPREQLPASRAELMVLNAWRDCRDLEVARFPTIGWVHKDVWLEPRPQWEVHDLSDLAIIRLAGLPLITQVVACKVRLFGPPKGPTALKWLRFKISLAMRTMASPKVQGRQVLIDEIRYRNTVALTAFSATGRDTVLVWGAAHIPGLDNGIRKAGLRHTGTDWHTVTEIPRLWNLLHKPPSTTAAQQFACRRPGR